MIRQGTDAVLDTVRKRADARRTARRERLGDVEVQRSTDLRREIVGASDDFDVLTALASVFTTGAAEAKGIAGDCLDELPKRAGKARASLKVGDGHGYELSIVRSKATTTKVDDAEVDEVIVASLIAEHPPGTLPLSEHPIKSYAQGAREALAALRAVLSASPGYKSTALDAFVKRLENDAEEDLATRLSKAYGRVERGEATVKIDRKPLPAEKVAEQTDPGPSRDRRRRQSARVGRDGRGVDEPHRPGARVPGRDPRPRRHPAGAPRDRGPVPGGEALRGRPSAGSRNRPGDVARRRVAGSGPPPARGCRSQAPTPLRGRSVVPSRADDRPPRPSRSPAFGPPTSGRVNYSGPGSSTSCSTITATR